MIRHLGTLFMVLGLSGFVLMEAMPHLPPQLVEPVNEAAASIDAGLATPDDAAFAISGTSATSGESTTSASAAPITRLVIPSIDLDTPVVPAPLTEHDGTTTWSVPKFVAGHAEGSAGAGEAGNAILIGHVTSLTLGHVFEQLDHVTPGDSITVYSSAAAFAYRVTDVASVERTDVDVLDSTSTPTLTLVTCSGYWLPTISDYTERMVVRAELVQ